MNCAARHRGGGEGEVEITSQMIEVGFQVLRDSEIADDLLEADKCMVAEVYRAMFVLRVSQSG